MTREEAKQKLWATGKVNTLSKVECDNIINELCDDFDEEVEEYVERMSNISDDCVAEIQELEKEFESEIKEKDLIIDALNDTADTQDRLIESLLKELNSEH